MNLIEKLLFEHSKKNIVKIVTEIKNDSKQINALIKLIYDENQTYSSKASWVFSEIYKNDGNIKISHCKILIEYLKDVKIDGIKRNILSAFETKQVEHDLLGNLVDLCFKFLIAPNETVAVKVYSMQIIANSCCDYPELKLELIAAIDQEYDRNTISFKARAKQIKKKLARLKISN